MKSIFAIDIENRRFIDDKEMLVILLKRLIKKSKGRIHEVGIKLLNLLEIEEEDGELSFENGDKLVFKFVKKVKKPKDTDKDKEKEYESESQFSQR
jgi:hypothetical protein